MSKLPGDEPADRPHLAVPLRPASSRSTGQSAEDRRRRSLLCHDVADDPAGGVALYEALASQDTTGLSADEWADRLEALERMNSRVAAWKSEAIAGFDDALHGVSADLGHRHPRPGDRAAAPGERRWHAGDLRSVADEIALILNLRKPHATARIHTSCELVHNFPATLHALREGWLTERAAFTIVDQLSVLDDLDDLRAAETAVLAWARTHPLTDLKQQCQRETAHRCPAASSRRHQRAHDERSVRMIPDGDGRAVLILDQDAIDAAAVSTSLSRAAARARRNGDPRTTGQLRADIALNRLLPRTRTTPAATSTGTATRAGEPAPAEPGANTTHEPPHRNQRTHTASNSHTHDLTPPMATEPPHDPSTEPPHDRSTEPPDDCRYDPFDGLSTEPPDDCRYDPFDDRGHQPPHERDHESPADRGHESPDLGHEPSREPGQDPFDDGGDEALDNRGYEPFDDAGGDPFGDRDYEPAEDDSAAEHPDDDRADDLGQAAARPDPEVPDDASIGAEAIVVIHATAAEVTALIHGEAATGGEADHHGPIPQSSLRKHLIKALTQGLLPNLPTTPTSPHPGATTRRPRTNTTTATAPHDTRPTNTTTPHDP
ncbi:DUF222 domain-containing protein, partial [Kribbella sp. NPDC006257]|uniref:DUF222 domain-containing protein n=1 Tax=Kribbella sp. NPDC006257 TaxID=3156738 RepID=UPI0033B1B524